MKNGGDQWQVDDSLLTETGRGGLFTDGYLQGRPLESYFERGETPLFVFGDSKRGVTRVDGDETKRILPASGFRAMTAVTDRHVQFVVGGGGHDGDWDRSIRLSDVDRVAVDEGLIRDQLSLFVDGTEWQVYLKDVSTERVVTFLEDISWAWIQVEQEIEAARKRLVDATQQQKSREYGDAEASLADARHVLAEAKEAATSVPEAATEGLIERVSQIESRYRDTKRRLHASRATHLVDEAERQWRNDEFETAYESFVAAREQYEAVLDIYGLEPHKEEAMRERIEHVDTNLELLSSAPIDRADETRHRAMTTEDPETALETWQEAFEQYEQVIVLDWGKDHKRFDGDIDLVRDRVVEATDNIVEARHALADQCRERGDEAITDGDVGAARDAYTSAISHLEAAEETAREFSPASLPRIHDRLDELATCIDTAAESVAADGDGNGDSEYSDFDNWVTLSEEEETTTTEPEPASDPTDVPECSVADGGPDIDEPEPDGPATPDDGTVDSLQDVPDPFEGDTAEQDPPSSVVETVRTLESRVLLEVAEATWSELGWSTAVDDSDGAVVATRENPDPTTRLIVITDHVGVSAVEECTDLRAEADADQAILLTSDTATEAVTRTATEAAVELLDPEAFARLLDREDLTDLLPDATA